MSTAAVKNISESMKSIPDRIYDAKENSYAELQESRSDTHQLSKFEEFASLIGKGSCGALNILKEKSNAHRTYYQECVNSGKKISVYDHIVNAVNMVSRGTGYVMSNAVRLGSNMGKAFVHSDAYSSIKNAISKGYDSLGNYLNAKSDQYNSENSGFKSFMTSVGRTIHAATGYGATLVNRAGASFKNTIEDVKKSDSYAKLQNQKAEMDAKEDVEKTDENEYDM